jgi:hypothetical protein
MPVSETGAVRQALRLSILICDSSGSSETAQDEILSALKKYAVNDEHCVRMVDAWIASEKYRPLPADIRRLADSVPMMDHSRPEKSCKACLGTGWEYVWTLCTYEKGPSGGTYCRTEIIPTEEQAAILRQNVDGQKQRVYTAVRRCTECRYGQRMASEENARAGAA